MHSLSCTATTRIASIMYYLAKFREKKVVKSDILYLFDGIEVEHSLTS